MTRRDDIEEQYNRVMASGKAKKSAELAAQVRWEAVHIDGEIPVGNIVDLLHQCDIGDGSLYARVVMEALPVVLQGIVDCQIARRQSPPPGGLHCIVELPVFRDKDHIRLWQSWSEYYGIRSIFAGVMNTVEQANGDDIRCLATHLRDGGRGRLGIFVSRSGFADGAISAMREMANEHKILVLPLDHEELQMALGLSAKGLEIALRYLHVRGGRLCKRRQRFQA